MEFIQRTKILIKIQNMVNTIYHILSDFKIYYKAIVIKAVFELK
jgi:hypothetical protein